MDIDKINRRLGVLEAEGRQIVARMAEVNEALNHRATPELDAEFNDLDKRMNDNKAERERLEATLLTASTIDVGAPRQARFKQALRGADWRTLPATSDKRDRDEARQAFTSYFRGLNTLTGTAGGFLVPDTVSAEILQLITNETIMMKLADVHPLPAGDRSIVVEASLPSPDWRYETDAVAVSQPTFDTATINYQNLGVIVKATVEQLEDSMVDLEALIGNQIVRAMALKVDDALLNGVGADRPMGLLTYLSTSPTTSINVDVDAAAPNYLTWADVAAASTQIEQANFKVNGFLLNPRDDDKLTMAVDTTGQYIVPPARLTAIPRYRSNQMTIVGGKAQAIIGDFQQFHVGVRSNLSIRRLDEKYADTNEVAWLATMRLGTYISPARDVAFVRFYDINAS